MGLERLDTFRDDSTSFLSGKRVHLQKVNLVTATLHQTPQHVFSRGLCRHTYVTARSQAPPLVRPRPIPPRPRPAPPTPKASGPTLTGLSEADGGRPDDLGCPLYVWDQERQTFRLWIRGFALYHTFTFVLL